LKQLFSIILLIFPAVLVNAQRPDSLRNSPPREFNQSTGLTGYYFWQEDTSGTISPESFSKPFFQNRIVLQRSDRPLPAKTPPDLLQQAIHLFTHDPKWDPDNSYWFYRLFHGRQRKLIKALGQKLSEKPSSVVWLEKNGQWSSREEHSVLYFNVDAAHNRHFSHSSDSLIVPQLHTSIASNGLYEVVTYLNEYGIGDSVRVLGYNGTDFTDSLRKRTVSKPTRLLLLVNGYRGPKKDDDPGDGLITQKDRYYYWYKIDNRFQDVLKPDAMFFADGSFPISTSNHRTKLRFAMSWLRARLTPKNKTSDRIYKRLNTHPNSIGFQYRKTQGKIAGEAFLLARCLSPLSDTVKDTLDIVCHSMGYAYTLGFLEVVKDRVVLNTIYILAPENPMEEGFEWERFRRVWQYGSNYDQKDRDPLRLQDGIAPQSPVRGLDKLPPGRGGRIFFPSDWPGRNFVDSHMVYSYDWIFDCIPEGEPGYIER
jgi:hypothetical protein